MSNDKAQETKDIFAKLKAPFSSKYVEWRIGSTNQEKTRGRAVPYLKSKAVVDRLDEALGEANWTVQYVSGPAGGVLCRLSLRIGTEWICKENGAGNTEVEGIKGGLTDAFKRTASTWGVGRYLQDYDAISVDLNPHGRFQAPALPDDMLPAEEVAANLKAENETCAQVEKTKTENAAPSPSAETPKAKSVSKPVKTPKAETVKVQEAPVATPDVSVQPLVALEDTTNATEGAVAEVVKASEVAGGTGGPEIAEDAKVEEVTVVAAVAEVALGVAGAETVVAAVAGVAPGVADAETVVAISTEAVIAVDENGFPLMPVGLPEAQMKRIEQLVERIEKGVPLDVIRAYVKGPKGLETLMPVTREYILARITYKEKLLAETAEVEGLAEAEAA